MRLVERIAQGRIEWRGKTTVVTLLVDRLLVVVLRSSASYAAARTDGQHDAELEGVWLHWLHVGAGHTPLPLPLTWPRGRGAQRMAASASRVECCAAGAAPWIGCTLSMVAASGPMRMHKSPGCRIAVRQSVQQPFPAPGAQDP